ncbi:MAG TPA: hypothetical protein VHV50_09135 [Actinomycetota bacterium]|jgi:hypothetical protein|nr:hypothetical protein [Actinomycetota bacterium]
MKLRRTIAILASLAVLTTTGVAALQIAGNAAPHHQFSRIALRQGMRRLWEDHVFWTRLFIVDAGANSAETDLTAARLLRNQEDIGNAIKPFYGDKAEDTLVSLLRRHILLAATMVKAAIAGDQVTFNHAKEQWYANANQIARFLHSLNPHHWGLSALQMMMKGHLDLTLKEAVDHLTGNFKADIADFDRVENEILQMADMLSKGIIQQFPNRF